MKNLSWGYDGGGHYKPLLNVWWPGFHPIDLIVEVLGETFRSMLHLPGDMKLYGPKCRLDYWKNRMNLPRLASQNPNNDRNRLGCPFDGTCTWVSEKDRGIGQKRSDYYYIKYTEGPGDRAFVEKTDRDYIL